MEFKTELNTVFYNYNDNTNWVSLSSNLAQIIEKYYHKPIDPNLIYKSLSFCDKNSQSFIKTLTAKMIRNDYKEAQNLMDFFKTHYPNYINSQFN